MQPPTHTPNCTRNRLSSPNGRSHECPTARAVIASLHFSLFPKDAFPFLAKWDCAGAGTTQLLAPRWLLSGYATTATAAFIASFRRSPPSPASFSSVSQSSPSSLLLLTPITSSMRMTAAKKVPWYGLSLSRFVVPIILHSRTFRLCFCFGKVVARTIRT
ncbi:hypothetical protein Nepgr_022352 [Nepenthes gracilis]|uniref:Uncharacterized protein n=1 Tax=Nepenthes gracilis TaxID=150966 RepID=A0AAD3T2E9_NEPGR|nr:hypothetical protein Nepgr_022352 [Nepenthes gracilis]